MCNITFITTIVLLNFAVYNLIKIFRSNSIYPFKAENKTDDGEVVITSGSSTELLGEILLSRFVFPYELVSFVLLAALIGGITLARKDEALIDEDQV